MALASTASHRTFVTIAIALICRETRRLMSLICKRNIFARRAGQTFVDLPDGLVCREKSLFVIASEATQSIPLRGDRWIASLALAMTDSPEHADFMPRGMKFNARLEHLWRFELSPGLTWQLQWCGLPGKNKMDLGLKGRNAWYWRHAASDGDCRHAGRRRRWRRRLRLLADQVAGTVAELKAMGVSDRRDRGYYRRRRAEVLDIGGGRSWAASTCCSQMPAPWRKVAMPPLGAKASGSTCSAPSMRSSGATVPRSQRREDRRYGLRHHFIGLGRKPNRQLIRPDQGRADPMAKGLARQYAGKKIRVNVVSPGAIYFKGGIWHMIEQNMPKRYQDTLARNPTGRMGTPQEIANAAVFLASPASSFTTGSNLVVDGAVSNRVNF
jgi:3-oxoacyl-[acyl-carrier protein] reductase